MAHSARSLHAKWTFQLPFPLRQWLEIAELLRPASRPPAESARSRSCPLCFVTACSNGQLQEWLSKTMRTATTVSRSQSNPSLPSCMWPAHAFAGRISATTLLLVPLGGVGAGFYALSVLYLTDDLQNPSIRLRDPRGRNRWQTIAEGGPRRSQQHLEQSGEDEHPPQKINAARPRRDCEPSSAFSRALFSLALSLDLCGFPTELQDLLSLHTDLPCSTRTPQRHEREDLIRWRLEQLAHSPCQSASRSHQGTLPPLSASHCPQPPHLPRRVD